MPAQFVGFGDTGQVLLQAQYLQNGQVGADGDTRSTSLQSPQGHLRHTGTLRHLLGGKLASQASQTQAFAQVHQ